MTSIKTSIGCINCETIGKGEPLLLIAGLGSDSSSWAGVITPLSKHFKVIAFDNRGCGKSNIPSGPYTISDMAGDAVKLLDSLGIRKAHVLGHSMGGYIAQELAIDHPDRVNKLVLESTSLVSSERNNKLFAGFLEELKNGSDYDRWIRNWTSWLFSPKTLKNKELISAFVRSAVHYPLRQSTEGFAGQASAIASFDSRGKTGLIKAKTLVLEGESDTLILPKEAEALAKCIKGSELRLLKDAGHAIHIESPGSFTEEVLGFLRTAA